MAACALFFMLGGVIGGLGAVVATDPEVPEPRVVTATATETVAERQTKVPQACKDAVLALADYIRLVEQQRDMVTDAAVDTFDQQVIGPYITQLAEAVGDAAEIGGGTAARTDALLIGDPCEVDE